MLRMEGLDKKPFDIEEEFEKRLTEQSQKFEEKLKVQEQIFEKKIQEHDQKFKEQLKELEEKFEKKRSECELMFEKKLNDQGKELERKEKEQQQQKEFEEKLREHEQKFERKLSECELMFEKKLNDQGKELERKEKEQQQQKEFEEKLREHEQNFEKKLKEQKQELERLRKREQGYFQKFEKLREHDTKLKLLREKSDQNHVTVKEISNFIDLTRQFAMDNFSKEKAKDMVNDWKSPAMYTHLWGYKFCIGIDANGAGVTHGKAVKVYICAMQGDYDSRLQWPAQAKFTIELINQNGGENIRCVTKESWSISAKQSSMYLYVNSFISKNGHSRAFLDHSHLKDFLNNDTIYFCITNVTVYS